MKIIITLLALTVSSLFAADLTDAQKQTTPRLKLKYVDWDHYMLGIDTTQKKHKVKQLVKRTPVIALVSFSGLNKNALKYVDIEYKYGPSRHRGMHDTYQISEVFQIARGLGIKIKFKVYMAADHTQIAEAFRLAGKEADIVITYYSFWHNYKAMQNAVAENPDTLYISPYVEVKNRRTNTCFQGGARHPDGTGLKNLITSIPLCRHKPSGRLLTPSCRDKNDIETINFVAPSSYASSLGETCPSAGVTAVAAAYIASTSEKKMKAEDIISIMLRNTSFPGQRMLKLQDFNVKSVELLSSCLKKLTAPDANGIRRLESDGVLDLWKIYEDLSGKAKM